MPVTTRPIDILNLAYGRNSKNIRNVAIAEATEGLRIVYRALRGLYAAGARINPAYFGDVAANVASTGGTGWVRPELAEMVYRIEKTVGGAKVWLSPMDDRLVNRDKPSVYRWGKIYRPIGHAMGPVLGDNLNFYFSKIPAQPETVDTVLDASWNEAYNELLGLEAAIYMALKDERLGEVELLKAERDPWAQQFIAHLEHETIGEVQQFAEEFRTSSLISINSLFAGGASEAA